MFRVGGEGGEGRVDGVGVESRLELARRRRMFVGIEGE